MYEILKQYEKIGRREMTVTELRELLGIAPTEYADRTGWSNFKNYKPPEEEDYTGGESSFNIDKWYQPAESYDPESIEFK